MASRKLPDADNTSWMLSGEISTDFAGIPSKPPQKVLDLFLPEQPRATLALVYVLDGPGDIVKIGKTMNPRQRIHTLCQDYRPTETAELPYKRFYLSHWHTYAYATETELHKRFDSCRIRYELFRTTARRVLAELKSIRLQRTVHWCTPEEYEGFKATFGMSDRQMEQRRVQQAEEAAKYEDDRICWRQVQTVSDLSVFIGKIREELTALHGEMKPEDAQLLADVVRSLLIRIVQSPFPSEWADRITRLEGENITAADRAGLLALEGEFRARYPGLGQ